ncbi:WYL domain-containing protein [Rubinisphaera sp.]|uniref:helix-turn-helix transcriptional regulator n=1 Tax=Rubinisphaera sp. TaxID=2024857 RepID=UPI000C0F920E|nr:WYL domain-containing protein [Rubinisphaera sp.]MBV10242.1 transcriptional regulator [Rubinisphaera sp.]HCS54136.1 transcriptional regulator [Planctomycetaceae bacterium]|tara:strand:- start:7806 stop:8816 length:1011 start_codon:yes stop_codon:yes gene_type:complete
MGESYQLMRQWRILQLLSARRYGMTVKELADEGEVHTRTILRDLNLLKTVGFPIHESVGSHGRKHWKINSEVGIAQLQFTLEEAAALYLGRQFLEAFAGTLFWKGSQSAFQKMRAALSDQTIEYLEKLAATVHLSTLQHVDYSDRAELIDELMMAAEERRLTVITYQSLRSTEPVTFYDIHPYAIVFHKGALYLIAWSLQHKQIRTFKIDRISEVEVQSGLMKFKRPQDFQSEEFLANSFGIFSKDDPPSTVRVRFSKDVVRILNEKKFHPSQELVPQSDGSVIAAYSLSTFEEFRSWLLSFGRHARVIEPEELIEQIRDEVGVLSQMYLNSVSNK